jgi:hypothetical protein
MVRCKSRFRSQGKEEYHCDTKFNSLKTLHFIFSVNQIAIQLNAPCNTPPSAKSLRDIFVEREELHEGFCFFVGTGDGWAGHQPLEIVGQRWPFVTP